MTDMPAWLQVLGALCALAIFIERAWPRAWHYYERRRVAHNRASLAMAGLTPERYMATIDPTDYQSYAEAVLQLWPRRTRHERRGATLDRISKDLGPLAAHDVRALKDATDRLNGHR